MAAPDRWAPWIEPPINDFASAAQNIVSGAAAAQLGALTFQVTPHVDCYGVIPVAVDVDPTVIGISSLLVTLRVNGVAQAQNLVYKGVAVNDRQSLVGVYHTGLLPKDTVATFALYATPGAGAGSTYQVRFFAGALALSWLGPSTFMPRLHAP